MCHHLTTVPLARLGTESRLVGGYFSSFSHRDVSGGGRNIVKNSCVASCFARTYDLEIPSSGAQQLYILGGAAASAYLTTRPCAA
eukprot:scaffold58031_cov60-Phaeocystis_antarctica.AAC.1